MFNLLSFRFITKMDTLKFGPKQSSTQDYLGQIYRTFFGLKYG